MSESKDSLGNLEDLVPQPYKPEDYPPDLRKRPRTPVLKRLRSISDKTLKQFGMLDKSGKLKDFKV